MLTTIWVIVMVTLAVGLSLLLMERVRRGQRKLTDFAPAGRSVDELGPGIAADITLGDLWARYSSELVTANGGRKTHRAAAEVFDPSAVLARLLALRLWQSSPGWILGLGILGTFVGLVVGLARFDTTDADAIAASIEALLNGVNTAFVTSIWGMLLSIAFGVLERWQLGRLEEAADRWTTQLDDAYLLSEDEATRLRDRRVLAEWSELVVYGQGAEAVTPAAALRGLRESAAEQNKALEQGREDLRGLLVFSDGVNDVRPADVLRDLQRESGEQTKSLKSFTDDLASGIKLSEETLAKMVSQLGGVVEEQVVDKLTPAISGIHENTTRMAGARQESQTEVVAHAIQELQQSLARMFADFQSAVAGSTQSQMDDLATKIAEAGAGLGAFAERMEEVSDSLRGHVDETRRLMTGSAERILAQINAETASQAAALAEVRDSFRQAADSSASSLSDAMDDVAGRMQTVGERLGNDALQAGERLNSAGAEALELLTASMDEAAERQSRLVAEGAAAAGDAATSVARAIRTESAQALSEIGGATSELVGRVERLLADHARVLATIDQAIERMGEVLGHSESFVTQVAAAAAQVATTEGSLEEAAAALRTTSTSLENTGASLLSTMEQFGEHADEISARNIEAVMKIEGLLQESARVASTFGVIRDGIADVFKEIESGLDRYENAVRENVGRHLVDFTSQFSASVDALSGTVDQLREAAEEMADVFERARTARR